MFQINFRCKQIKQIKNLILNYGAYDYYLLGNISGTWLRMTTIN